MKRILISVVMALALASSANVGFANASEPQRLGDLVVSPASGDGTSAIDVVTAGECTRGTHFTLVIDGPGLKNSERGNLVGATKLSSLQPAEYPGHYLLPIPVSLDRYFAETAPGLVPRGTYTLSFICRDTLSVEPLQVFSGDLVIKKNGTYVAQGPAGQSVESLVGSQAYLAYEQQEPRPGDVIIGDLTETATEDLTAVEAAALNTDGQFNPRPFLLLGGIAFLVIAFVAWLRIRPRSQIGTPS